MKMRARNRHQQRPRRDRVRFGVAAGRFAVPADFDAPLPPEVLASFEGDFEPPKANITVKPIDLED